MIKQDGHLVAQSPGPHFGSVSVEFLKAWDAASLATCMSGAIRPLSLVRTGAP